VRPVAGALFIALAVLAAGAGASASPPSDFSSFAFRPHPGRQLPLAVTLVDEHGRTVTLAHFFTGKPVVLVLEYLRCKSLCGLTLQNVIQALDALPLRAGRDYEMLAISVDPRDTPADIALATTKYLALYHHRGGAGGIHLLIGAAASVRQVADAIGFPYRYNAAIDQFSHPVGFILASPDGRISRYVFGVGADAAKLPTALADAARDTASSPLTRLFLLCHIEGTPLGRYTVPVLAALTTANIAAGTALIILFAAIRRRRHG
jgi:protein SCO1